MFHIEPFDIVQKLIALMLAAILTAWSWLAWQLWTGQPVLPAQPHVTRRPVPWGAGTVLIVFLLYISISLSISVNYRTGARVLTAILRGRSVVEDVDQLRPSRPAEPSPDAVKAPAEHARAPVTGDLRQAPLSHLMFLNGAVTVIMLVLIPLVVRMTSGARLDDFGLSFADGGHQALSGVVATLIAAPPVYAIQAAAQLIWKSSEHPLSKMMTEEFSVGVGWLAVVTAVILAPIFEELIFRGLLQSWLVTLLDRRWRRAPVQPTSITGSELAVENAPRADEWSVEPEPRNDPPTEAASTSDSSSRRDRSAIAIVLTSALFAYVHAPQWPAPIALFALALVIGTVYHRTGSLIAAVCMHATFNGISTLVLFAGVLAGDKLEPEKAIGKPAVELQTRLRGGEKVRLVALTAGPRS